jgi:hypothetical protein
MLLLLFLNESSQAVQSTSRTRTQRGTTFGTLSGALVLSYQDAWFGKKTA